VSHNKHHIFVFAAAADKNRISLHSKWKKAQKMQHTFMSSNSQQSVLSATWRQQCIVYCMHVYKSVTGQENVVMF